MAGEKPQRSMLRPEDLGSLGVQMKLMSDLIELHKKFNAGVEKLAAHAKSIHESSQAAAKHAERIYQLPKGPRGDKGDMPEVDIHAIAQQAATLIPIPKDGKTPDIGTLAQQVLALIPTPRDGRDAQVDHEKIADLVIERMVKGKKLKPQHIDGLKGEMDSYRAQLAGKHYGKDTWARGGGDTVEAGSNITITTTTGGKKQISASVAGFALMVPTGLVDGSNTTFVWPSAPSVIVLDNANTMNKTSADGTTNWAGTTTTVLTQAPNFNIYGY